ncbi:MAG: DUF2239 family protein [Rhodoferax sp.]|jgi:hypothetical protein|nr:DUF2239 family protein [Rhodoferax sp.]
MDPTPACIAFRGTTCLTRGPLPEVLQTVRATLAADPTARILVFDARSSQQIDLDLRHPPEAAAVAPPPADPATEPAARSVGPGRPRLGVVAREVTLLPRHWEWLGAQPGGASVALRRLVEQARRDSQPQEERRQAQESCYRFMVAIAGDLPGFEEATRALFAGRLDDLAQQVAGWPADVAAHLLALAQPLRASATDRETRHA